MLRCLSRLLIRLSGIVLILLLVLLSGCSGPADPLAGIRVVSNIPDVFGINKAQEVDVSLTTTQSAALFGANSSKLGINNANASYPVSIVDTSTDTPIVCTPNVATIQVNATSPTVFSCIAKSNDPNFTDQIHTLHILVANRVLATKQVTVSKFTVMGKVTRALPTILENSITYRVSMIFTNLNQRFAISGVNISKSLPEGFSETSNTCGSTLAALSSCQVNGTYNAPDTATGPISVDYTLSYAEGADVSLNTTASRVTDVSVVGSVVTPLPQNIEKDTSYPVTFKFSNMNQSFPASQISLTSAPSGFVETSNDCKLPCSITQSYSCLDPTEIILAPSSSCTINGIYTPTVTSGSVSIGYTLSYNSGEDERESVAVTTTSNVIDVDIAGEVTQALPPNILQGQSYQVTFRFTNDNLNLPATGLVLAGNHTGFTETQNTCGSTLAPNSSCEITGEYTSPMTSGPVTLSCTLTYDQGADLTLFTNSNVLPPADPAVITGEVTGSLPPILQSGDHYPVTFTFTNTGESTATGIATSGAPLFFYQASNDCVGSLAANQSCTITGFYTPFPTSGPVSVNYTLSYDQGANVSLTSGGEVLTQRAYIANSGINSIFVCSTQNWATSQTLNIGNNASDSLQDLIFNTIGSDQGFIGVSLDSDSGIYNYDDISNTWGALQSSATNLWAITQGDDGKMVAVGSGSNFSGTISYNDPNINSTWTQNTNFPAGRYFSVAYGNNTYVAVGQPLVTGNSGIITTSDPNATWTDQTKPSDAETPLRVTYSPDSDQFYTLVSTGSTSSDNRILYSNVPYTDWQSVTGSDTSTLSRADIASGNGLVVIAGIADFSARILGFTETCLNQSSNYCENFNNWQTWKDEFATPALVFGNLKYGDNIFLLGASNNFFITGLTNNIYMSFDGVHWAGQSGNGVNVNTVAYNENPTDSSKALIAIGRDSNFSGAFTTSPRIGTLSSCTIDAGISPSTPTDVVLNPSLAKAYITNAGNNTVSRCDVNSMTGFLSNCVATGSGFSSPQSIVLYNSINKAYIVNGSNSTVSVCDMNSSTGALSNCQSTGSGFSNPRSIVLYQNTLVNKAYVTNIGNNSVSVCDVNDVSGALTNCISTGSNFNVPQGLALFMNDTLQLYRAYIANTGDNTITMCKVDETTGAFFDCQNTGSGFNFSNPNRIAIRPKVGKVYVLPTSGSDTVLCDINASTGDLSNCESFPLIGASSPRGMTILE
ncbi:MAG: beta-propeller fold lactonase family protein [Pseudomonadota bacterium]